VPVLEAKDTSLYVDSQRLCFGVQEGSALTSNTQHQARGYLGKFLVISDNDIPRVSATAISKSVLRLQVLGIRASNSVCNP
jgi:hypothetical protein